MNGMRTHLNGNLMKIKSNFEKLYVNPVKSWIIGSLVEKMITQRTIWSNIKLSMRNLNNIYIYIYHFSNLINEKKSVGYINSFA